MRSITMEVKLMPKDQPLTSPWWVYIIKTKSGLLYTGCTTDVERRYNEHQASGVKAAKFLKGKGPLTLMYQEPAIDKSAALKREIEIKKMSRDKKICLIALGSKTEK